MSAKDSIFSPKVPIPTSLVLSLSSFTAVSALLLWWVLSFGGLVRPDFLPTPTAVLAAGVMLIADGMLLTHVWSSASVILLGFALSSLIAVPLGLLMGSFGIAAALMEPITGFMRYLPITAMIPLLILWVGIGLEQKVAVIFLGTVFQQLIMISDIAARISKDLIDVAYTLGAGRRQVFWRVLVPASLPGVMDTLRVTLGLAWTYLVVAELVASNAGLGYMIINAMRGLATEVVILGVFVIGLLGLFTDIVVRRLSRWLLPWATTVS